MRSGTRKWNYALAVIATATLMAATLMGQAKGKTVTMTGTVNDFMCGTKHTMMPGTPDKECTLTCIKMGSKYGLVVADKVYQLDGKEAELEKFAGGKAKITGTLDGDTIHVTAVAAG
jgi:hypothetical protein